MKKQHKLLLGAHMSIAGGLEKALIRGASIACTAIQIFTHSNRQWGFKPLTPGHIAAYKQAQQETQIHDVVCHSSYLINLGSSSHEVVKKSVEALSEELRRCDQLGIRYLVLHPGSGSPQADCLEKIADGINHVFSKETGSTIICLETMAGQGNSVGKTFKELAIIRSLVTQKERIGFCLDTCHIWAAGHNIHTKDGYDDMMRSFDDILDLKQLFVIHLNDSKKACGSRVDRHEDIGKGAMGLAPFRYLMNDERLFDVIKVLETPKEHLSDDARNIKILQRLLSKTTQDQLDVVTLST